MEIEEFNTRLWFIYPKDLCHGKKGTKFNAEKAARKIKPDQYEKILANVEALIRFDRKDFKPDRWPFVSSFLNQGYYDRDIGSTQDIKQKQELSICSVDGCNKEVHGMMFNFCAFHIPSSHSDDMKQAWIRTGIDYKSPTLTEDCRKHCRIRMDILIGKTI